MTVTEGIIFPPWSEEEVSALNAYQQHAPMHPFTCPNRGDDEHRIDGARDEGILVATPEGWVCPAPSCPYVQSWAHAFMADTSWWGGVE